MTGSVRNEEDGKLVVDFEGGEKEKLYPGLSYGKVFGILTVQIVLTTLVSAITVLYSPFNDLLRGNSALLLFLSILPFILLWPLQVYHQKHPVNLIVLGLFAVSLNLPVAVSCPNTDAVLEATFLTSAVVCSLSGYTFWASKKGKDFSFMGPLLFNSAVIIILNSFLCIFYSLWDQHL